MTVYPNRAFPQDTKAQSRAPARKGPFAAPLAVRRRTPVRRLDQAGTAAGTGVAPIWSIEEEIARYDAAQPPQLYRGGA